jgi:hypothetical protein
MILALNGSRKRCKVDVVVVCGLRSSMLSGKVSCG